MKVVELVRFGNDASSFQIKEVEKPAPKSSEVLIKVQAFGLNYADVMERLGLYRDAPPLPFVPGYEVVGVIENVGDGVDRGRIGKRVVSMTEFGGYAEYVVAPALVAVDLPIEMPLAAAAALATQYSTAYYGVFHLANVQPNDVVFIHAAAGGVGLALIEFCKMKNCTIYGTVSSDEKGKTISKLGVHQVINSKSSDVVSELRKLDGKIDVIFDSVGGKGVGAGFKALRAGGRLVCYGGAKLADGKGVIGLMRFALSTGFFSPIQFLSTSKSILGLNMLKLLRARPELAARFLNEIVELVKDKKINLPLGQEFPIDKLFEAHELLGSRKSIGKIVVKW